MIISEYPLYKAVNSFGLFLDLIGVAYFIFKQGYKVWMDSGGKKRMWGQSEQKARKEMKVIVMFFVLIALGFLFQIISNFIPESTKISDILGTF